MSSEDTSKSLWSNPVSFGILFSASHSFSFTPQSKESLIGVGVICSSGEKTCGACCWSPSLPRADVEKKLRRHRDLFPERGIPSAFGLLWHELRARRGLDLILAPLLWIPLARAWLRARLQARLVCAFVAFRDRSETALGCLLHPERSAGVDRRPFAFRLLRSFACGAPDYLCDGALRFEAAPPRERRRFQIAVRELDWFDYGHAASRFASHSGGTPCPSSFTRRST
jgi:hypothetical protein